MSSSSFQKKIFIDHKALSGVSSLLQQVLGTLSPSAAPALWPYFRIPAPAARSCRLIARCRSNAPCRYRRPGWASSIMASMASHSAASKVGANCCISLGSCTSRRGDRPGQNRGPCEAFKRIPVIELRSIRSSGSAWWNTVSSSTNICRRYNSETSAWHGYIRCSLGGQEGLARSPWHPIAGLDKSWRSSYGRYHAPSRFGSSVRQSGIQPGGSVSHICQAIYMDESLSLFMRPVKRSQIYRRSRSRNLLHRYNPQRHRSRNACL